jgi:hypothetical protein
MLDPAATRHRYRAMWISDTHLGTRDCQAHALLDFLEAHDCDHLYLVGTSSTSGGSAAPRTGRRSTAT